MHDYLHSFRPDEDAASPNEVRILSMKVTPLPDPLKVRVAVQLTPFKVPPDLAFRILDQDSKEVSSVSMIETVLDEFNFVMHLRKKGNLSGRYEIIAEILYRDFGMVDQKSISFEINAGPAE